MSDLRDEADLAACEAKGGFSGSESAANSIMSEIGRSPHVRKIVTLNARAEIDLIASCFHSSSARDEELPGE